MEEILHQLRLVGYLPLLTTGFFHPNGGWPGKIFLPPIKQFSPIKTSQILGFFIGDLTCSPQTQPFFSQWQTITFQQDGAKKSWPLEAEGWSGLRLLMVQKSQTKTTVTLDVKITKCCKMMANINHVNWCRMSSINSSNHSQIFQKLRERKGTYQQKMALRTFSPVVFLRPFYLFVGGKLLKRLLAFWGHKFGK